MLLVGLHLTQTGEMLYSLIMVKIQKYLFMH